jgi:hypothetical protein
VAEFLLRGSARARCATRPPVDDRQDILIHAIMFVLSLLLTALAQDPAITSAAPRASIALNAGLAADTGRAPGPASAPLAASDTPTVRRRRAVEYSDTYYTRLTIHRIGSYTMLPLFAAEWPLGQNLIQDRSPPSWMKPTHAAVAGGIGVLFTVNTITGLWNLWDARDDAAGRTRRTVHSILMLASDAGFAITGAVAPGGHDSNFSDLQNRRRLHRNVAIGSMAISTVGAAMMWFWKD